MTPRDLFGVGLRLIGIILCGAGSIYALFTFAALIRPTVEASAWDYFFWASASLSVGLYFLRGAPHIVRFAYEPSRESNLNPALESWHFEMPAVVNQSGAAKNGQRPSSETGWVVQAVYPLAGEFYGPW
jgi:hypothetical protein